MDQFKLSICRVFGGAAGSFRCITMLRDFKTRRDIAHCCVINGMVFLFSSKLFEYILCGVAFICGVLFEENVFNISFPWLKPYILKIFVILPIFLLNKFVWIILSTAKRDPYRCRHLRAERPEGANSLAWVVEYTLDPFISIVIHICFLLQSLTVSCIITRLFHFTFLSYLVQLMHMCILYSLLAFEFVWFSKGWEINRRLDYIEDNWLYFLGFGLPLTIATEFLDSWFLSGLLFAVMLPIIILSGSAADSTDKVCDILPLRIFIPTRTVSYIPIFIMKRKMHNNKLRKHL